MSGKAVRGPQGGGNDLPSDARGIADHGHGHDGRGPAPTLSRSGVTPRDTAEPFHPLDVPFLLHGTRRPALLGVGLVGRQLRGWSADGPSDDVS